MNLAQLFRTIRNRLALIASVVVVCVGLSVVWALLTAKTYRASAQVIINTSGPESLAQQASLAELSPDYLSTQIDVLQSDHVAQLVVQKLGLASRLGAIESLHWNGRGSVETFIATNLKRNLKITVSASKSRVISISYQSSSPEFSAAAANAFAEAFADAELDMQAQPARATALWYQKRLTSVQRDLMEAQRKLSDKQKELGITADAGHIDAEDARLQALSGQLALVQTQNAVTRSQATGQALGETLANPVIQGLQLEIAKAEAQRRQLSATLGPNNPDYKQIQSQIEGLQQQLNQQRALVRAGASSNAASTAGSVSQLTAAVGEQKQRLIDSRTRMNEVSVLQQDVRNLQTVYDQMAARRSQLDLLGESSQTNVSVLSPAVAPDLPAWPNRPLMVEIGLLVGIALGVGLAVLLELINRRMRNSADYDDWLGIANLGTLHIMPRKPVLLLARAQRLLPSRSSE